MNLGHNSTIGASFERERERDIFTEITMFRQCTYKQTNSRLRKRATSLATPLT